MLWNSDAAWSIALVMLVAALLTAPAAIAAGATFLTATAWCIRIDEDEHAVQVVDSVELALNR